jgi:fatty acid kinase fatty acid binding subunit
MAVRVVSDSACDLPAETCAALGIEIVPLTIRFGGDEYVDRTELSTEAFWTKLQSSPTLPDTAAPSVGAFEETFRALHESGADGIVCVNLSAHLSATMQSAQVAAKALDELCPIEIIDSASASMGIGILAIHAARRAAEGADVTTIAREVTERRERQSLYATLDTLEYLKKGGRIGGAQAMLGSMLSIKPIVTVVNGAVEQAGKVRTRSKALNFILDKVPAGRVESICVLHSGATDIEEFLANLRPKVEGAEIVVGRIGPVVGVHVGPGAVGVTWIERAQ